MTDVTQKTTWTWQTSLVPPGIRCELDGQFFPVSRAPMHVSPDGVLTLWVHHGRVQVGERPARRLVAHGRLFVVDEEPGAWQRLTTDEIIASMRGPVGKTPVTPGPEKVTALWFIVDDARYASPRVFRVRHEEVG